jgi:hypothetical protein
MRDVAGETGQLFRQKFVGRTMQVLWESSRWTEAQRVWNGLTDNYLRVFTAAETGLTNRMALTRLDALTDGGLVGTVVEPGDRIKEKTGDEHGSPPVDSW